MSDNKKKTRQEEYEDSWPSWPKEPSRAGLLAKGCRREPRRFHQIEGMAASHGEHHYPDEEGDMLSESIAFELLDCVDIRVLVRPDLDRESRVRLLAKILEGEAHTTYWYQVEQGHDPRRSSKPMPGLDFNDEDDDFPE